LSPTPSTHWDYSGFHLGNWYAAGYPLCHGEVDTTGTYSNNQYQSPINLKLRQQQNLTTAEQWAWDIKPLNLFVRDEGCPGTALLNGHTLEVEFANCTNIYLEYDGRKYHMTQFHFHSESENLLDGRHMAGEMHMVHASGDRNLVVAVFLHPSWRNESNDNKFIERIFGDAFGVEAMMTTQKMNPYAAMLTPGGTYTHFLGSLTTPPCTPNVDWIIMKEHVTIGKEKLDQFVDYLTYRANGVNADGNNFRPPQPLNNRKITLGQLCTDCAGLGTDNHFGARSVLTKAVVVESDGIGTRPHDSHVKKAHDP